MDDEIHHEWMASLVAASGIPPTRLQRTLGIMKRALPCAEVRGYERHVEGISLPDPDDRHVVAAGVEAGASTITTWNLRHFPDGELKRLGLQRETPDAFLVGVFDLVPASMTNSLAKARRNLSKTRVSANDFLEILVSQKLIELARRARKHAAEL